MEQNLKILCRSLMCVTQLYANGAITIKIGREMKDNKHVW